MIVNIIYNFDELRNLLKEKTKEGSFYLLHDDIYFEEITKGQNIIREITTTAKKIVKPFDLVKFVSFEVNKSYTTKEISNFIFKEREFASILVTIYDSKSNECFILFIDNGEVDLENEIMSFLETEN